MDEAKIRRTIALKLAHYRKANGLTQAELAEKINYSDKSVSKWERGDGVPDIFVLSTLAETYGISVEDFLSDNIDVQEQAELEQENSFIAKKNKLIITLLSVGLVWLAASTAFFVLKITMPDIEKAWYAFILAIPVSFIVTVVFAELWSRHLVLRCAAVSLLIWSVAVSVDVCLKVDNIYLIYIVAAVLQILTILWFLLKYKPRRQSTLQ